MDLSPRPHMKTKTWSADDFKKHVSSMNFKPDTVM